MLKLIQEIEKSYKKVKCLTLPPLIRRETKRVVRILFI